MRRSPDQLAASLERKLARVYFITGDEPLQRMECADAVRAAARAQAFDERVVLDSSTGIDWQALRFEADSLSLFASKRIIEIRLHEPKVGADGGEALRDYCSNPGDDTLLLISAPKFDNRSQNAEWYKALDRVGEVVQVWPIKTKDMPRWISKRMQQRGLKAAPEAVQLIADRVEGNLLAAVQDIEKLALLMDGEDIDVETIVGVVGDSARFDLFTLADTALAGDAARAVRILRGLRDEAAEPVLICWSLARELRAASILAGGGRPEQVMVPPVASPPYRMFPTREAPMKAAARRLGHARLQSLLLQATRTDRVAKGQAAGEVWDELTSLVLAMAGKPLGESVWTH
ncbi:MAG: DNA polymerase III subunit delta [Gammaproteobacteria bacterium]